MSEQEQIPDIREYRKDDGLDCVSNGCRDETEDHVKVHKYFLDRTNDDETDWDEAPQ